MTLSGDLVRQTQGVSSSSLDKLAITAAFIGIAIATVIIAGLISACVPSRPVTELPTMSGMRAGVAVGARVIEVYPRDTRRQPLATDLDEPDAAYYPTCGAVVRAGAAPLSKNDPGYRPKLDNDNNGVACDDA